MVGFNRSRLGRLTYSNSSDVSGAEKLGDQIMKGAQYPQRRLEIHSSSACGSMQPSRTRATMSAKLACSVVVRLD